MDAVQRQVATRAAGERRLRAGGEVDQHQRDVAAGSLDDLDDPARLDPGAGQQRPQLVARCRARGRRRGAATGCRRPRGSRRRGCRSTSTPAILTHGPIYPGRVVRASTAPAWTASAARARPPWEIVVLRLGVDAASSRRDRVRNLALLAAVAGVVVVATQADGYRKHEAQLNDGGIWVTNGRDGFHGRLNKPIGQLDGVAFAEQDTQLDVVQDGAAVIGLDVSAGSSPRSTPARSSCPTARPRSCPRRRRCGSPAAAWRCSTRPTAGSGRSGSTPASASRPWRRSTPRSTRWRPSATTSALAVTVDGDVLVASATDDALRTFPRSGAAFGAVTETDLGADVGQRSRSPPWVRRRSRSTVESGALQVVGGPEADVPPGSTLQAARTRRRRRPRRDPRRAGRDRPRLGGAAPRWPDDVSGRPGGPGPPRRLRVRRVVGRVRCRGHRVRRRRAGRRSDLGTETTDLVFRVNRGEIVLNDRTTGAVWNIDSDEPTRLDNWESLPARSRTTTTRQNENENEEQRRPATAQGQGRRPRRSARPHHRAAPARQRHRAPGPAAGHRQRGRRLRVRGRRDDQPRRADGPDRDAEGAGTGTRFDYTIDDGRSGRVGHASVTVTPAHRRRRTPRRSCATASRTTEWAVPAGGALDIPVLPDWRDKQDGTRCRWRPRSWWARQTPEPTRGRRPAAWCGSPHPPRAGGYREVLRQRRHRRSGRERAQSSGSRTARTARPTRARGTRHGRRRGGQDHHHPATRQRPARLRPGHAERQVAVAGKVAQAGGAEVKTDLVDGTLSFVADKPRTYFLTYDRRTATRRSRPAGSGWTCRPGQAPKRRSRCPTT